MASAFQDFDDQVVYNDLKSKFTAHSARNFIIDFTSTKALAAYNVEAETLKTLLKRESADKSTTRWINIWCPEEQRDVMKEIGQQYDFSSRLLAIMRSRHDSQYRKKLTSQQHQSPIHEKSAHLTDDFEDVESNAAISLRPRPSLHPQDEHLSHYRIVDEVWHYNSVDWGVRYQCIGYNVLHNVEVTLAVSGEEPADRASKDPQQSKPPGKRLWTWLVLCDDGTVISIFENPFPGITNLSADQARALSLTRKNVDNAFRHLSEAADGGRKENFMSALNVRARLPEPKGQALDQVTDGPSLLFYYLFDDWRTTYALVAQKANQYGSQLLELRGQMSRQPSVQLVNDLHHIGQELAILKRMYESYSVMIDRLLEKQAPPGPGSYNSVPTLEVRLKPDAIVRFERLKDRIQLLALSEVQSCLDEKDSLVFLNFNLITLSESAAIERLTRITILLAKVTVLFMPLGLLTSYFSTQIQEVQHTFTVVSYWVSFAVIFALSVIFLVAFGTISKGRKPSLMSQSSTHIIFDRSRTAYKERKERKDRHS